MPTGLVVVMAVVFLPFYKGASHVKQLSHHAFLWLPRRLHLHRPGELIRNVLLELLIAVSVTQFVVQVPVDVAAIFNVILSLEALTTAA